jgi:HMG (high mobility group) box
MSPIRLSRRRRSSIKFAPNVTPVSYALPQQDHQIDPADALFPPSLLPPPPPTRRRVPPGKRRSLGYIPRPPNAFMLFRADFVRQKHVPGSIETNHGSLSKIIGNCWKSLPLEEKQVWEVKAKYAKADHKARYPEYRFRPVHNKNKDKKKEKAPPSVEDERRCEEVAQLLLEGKKGDELAAAVRNLDRSRRAEEDASVNDRRNPHQPPYPNSNQNPHQHQHQLQQHQHYHYHPNPLPQHPAKGHRRSSSVPLPNDYTMMAMPTLPFLSSLSRPDSPVGNISRSTRVALGTRRSSSARPALGRAWTMPDMSGGMMLPFQRDDSPLPEPDTSLFEQSFLESNFSFPAHAAHGTHEPSFVSVPSAESAESAAYAYPNPVLRVAESLGRAYESPAPCDPS